MQELIAQLMEKFGTSQEGTESIVSTLMKSLRENVSADAFDQLADKVPGAKEMADAPAAAPAEDGGGGLLGSLTSMAAGALGGEAGSAMELTSVLTSAGVNLEQAGPLVTTVIDFLKEKAGSELIDGLLEHLPKLKELLG